MATIRCPQCGTTFEEGPEFCPNTSCGYPVEFALEPEGNEPTDPGSPRLPGGRVVPPAAPPRPQTPIAPPIRPAVAPPVAPPTPPRSVPLGPILGAIGVVVAIVGLAAFFLTRGSDEPPTTPSTQDRPAESIAWEKVGVDSLAQSGTQELAAVARKDKDLEVDWSLIAAGSTTLDESTGLITSDGSDDAAVWLSDTSGSWEPVNDFDLRSSDDQRVNGIDFFSLDVDGGNRIVAVGSDKSGDGDAAVWLSPDGHFWDRIFVPGSGEQEMTRVMHDEDLGFVAVGWDQLAGDVDGAIWTSLDGQEWELVSDDSLGGDGEQSVLRAIAFELNGETRLVAVGSSTEGGQRRAAVWTSPNGTDWDLVRDPTGVFSGGEIRDIRTYPDGLIAVGSDSRSGDRDGAVWISEDAQEWQRMDASEVLGGRGEQVITRVLAPGVTRDGVPFFMAGGYTTGTEGADAGSKNAAIWYSDDGASWTLEDGEDELGGVGEQEISSLTILGPRFIAVGSTDFSGRDAAVWVGTIEG